MSACFTGTGIVYWKSTNGDGTFPDLRSQRAHSEKLLLSRYGPDEPKTKRVPSPFVPFGTADIGNRSHVAALNPNEVGVALQRITFNGNSDC